MADNYFVIRKTSEGVFTYVEAYVEEENPNLTIKEGSPMYPTLTDALVSASRLRPERGIVIHKECYVG